MISILTAYFTFRSYKQHNDDELQRHIKVIDTLGDKTTDIDKKIRAREEKSKLDFARNLKAIINLKSLLIKDVTFFADTIWEFQPQINVLLGKNGYGKSHLLRTIVSLLQVDPKTYEVFGEGDKKALLKISLTRDDRLETLRASKEILKNAIGKMPVLAIPDSRFINKSRTSIASTEDDLIDLNEKGAYHFIHELPYEAIIQRFLHDLCITYLEGGKTFDLPVFGLISKVVNKLTDKSFAFHKIESITGEGRFRIKVFTEGNENNPLPIQKASQGTLSVVAMFGLIYNFLRSVWSDSLAEEIYKKPAIVFIDEIDAHLHPSWQQKFIGLLRETFPRVQFIMTAHSPIIVAGCLENEVAVLRKGQNGFFVEQVNEHLLGARSGELYSRLFETEDLDENFLYYLTQYTLSSSHCKRINELDLRKHRTSSEQDELSNLYRKVRYSSEAAEIKQRRESEDAQKQLQDLEAENRALKSQLSQKG